MRRSIAGLPLAAATVLLAAGCAAPNFVAQTGRVTPAGSFRASLGAGYQVNTSAADVVASGRKVAETLRSRGVSCLDPGQGPTCWNVADVKPVVDAAYRFALVAPLASTMQVQAHYGIVDRLEAGGRLGSGNKGLDLGWQFFGPTDRTQPGWAGTLSAGWGTRDMGTLGDVVESVLQGEAKLTDWQATMIFGRQFGEFGHFFVGPRYIMSRWKLVVLPDLPIIYGAAEQQKAMLGTDASGTIHHVGATIGGAVGYRHVYLGAELNLLQSIGGARILFDQRSFSSFGVMPAVYLTGQY
jgi:hypothetical protein